MTRYVDHVQTAVARAMRGSGAAGMLTDLAALVPPLLVAVAFLIGVGAFLRHEMGRRDRDSEGAADESTGPGNPGETTGRTSSDGSFPQQPNEDSGDTEPRRDG